jgi:hypothetical protein
MLTRRTAADGWEVWMVVNKKLLKRAMGLSANRNDGGPDCSSIPKLALAAQVSTSSIGFLVGTGKSSRDTCSVEMAHKIAAALGWDVDELFTERRLPTRRLLTGDRATRAERLADMGAA